MERKKILEAGDNVVYIDDPDGCLLETGKVYTVEKVSDVDRVYLKDHKNPITGSWYLARRFERVISEPKFPSLADLVNEKNQSWADAAIADSNPVGDAVTRPPHYTRFVIEPVTFCMRNKLEFWQGNVIKYVMRYDAKDGLQDLKKARRYIDMQINLMEGKATL